MKETIKKDSQDVLEAKNRRFKETWQPRLALIISIAAIIVSVTGIISGEGHGIRDALRSVFHQLPLIIIITNLLISIIALIFLAKQKTAEYVIQDKEKFKSLAELSEKVDVQIYTTNLNNRVERSVNQFRLHMTLFASSLTLIYGVILLANLTSSNEGDRIGYFRVTMNLLNLLGAVFIQLGFNVLYNKTLGVDQVLKEAHRESTEESKDQYTLETTQIVTYNSTRYWAIPSFLFVFYILLFVSLSISCYGGCQFPFIEVGHFLNISDLVAGSANGLAMSLLFGRYVSIEQSVGNTSLFKNVFENIFHPFSSIPYKVVVSLGIIFILPIYALAQPLFGALQINAFGNAKNFQTIVFAICLVGKICFLHLTYILISKKLLHLYLYGLVSNVGNFKELEACFDQKNKQEIDQ